MQTNFDQEALVKEIVKVVLDSPQLEELTIPVGVSNRHIHLSLADLAVLFGAKHQLHNIRELRQPGQYACEELVTLVGPKGAITNVRVLGPLRSSTQVEISLSDGYVLGITPPILESGVQTQTPTLTIVGPEGAVTISRGVMCAERHIHMNTLEAQGLSIKDGDRVSVQSFGNRSLIFNRVKVRVSDSFIKEIHVDVDEANAANLKNGDFVQIVEGSGGN